MRKILLFKTVGHGAGGGGEGRRKATELEVSPFEPVKCRVEEKHVTTSNMASGRECRKSGGCSTALKNDRGGGMMSTAVRRRSFSNIKVSRSIKIRKNVSLRTTLHSFPDNDSNSLPITVLKCQDYPVEDDDSPPLKSCMKIKTLEESLEGSKSERLAKYKRSFPSNGGGPIEEEKVEIDFSGTGGGDETPENNEVTGKRTVGVSFSTVEIREHKICLEENHATTSEACIVPDGLAITLDWLVVRTHRVDVEEFQRMKGPLKEKDDMKLSYDERFFKLIEWDISESEIRDAKEKQRKLLKSKRKGVRKIVTLLKTKKE